MQGGCLLIDLIRVEFRYDELKEEVLCGELKGHGKRNRKDLFIWRGRRGEVKDGG